MIPRYSLPKMAAVWSETRKLELWKEIETLVVEAWVELGVAPPGSADGVRSAPPVDPVAWKEREEITSHDLAAFVDVLAESAGAGGEWIHHGLAASDVLDTALGATLAEASDLLIERAAELFRTVKRRSLEHRDTVMVGRTHGVWAEPTTFGLKVATWAFELSRAHERLRRARETVAVGKISGAVGSYAHAPPEVEHHVCEALGLAVEPASSQVTMRDRHAEFLSTLALVGATLERIATELRHLQRSEVAEVREAFADGQKGSSSMPHKRNPITAENVTGLSRLLRGYASAGFENVALWHERDISHSSVERVALPDSCLVLDFALARSTALVADLIVDEDRMRHNLDASRGLVYSQAVLLALVERKGLTRDEAYRVVQRNAFATWEDGGDLRSRLAADEAVALEAAVLDECFSPERLLRRADVVFDRLEALEL